jgi:hypothetical protein
VGSAQVCGAGSYGDRRSQVFRLAVGVVGRFGAALRLYTHIKLFSKGWGFRHPVMHGAPELWSAPGHASGLAFSLVRLLGGGGAFWPCNSDMSAVIWQVAKNDIQT